MWVTITLQSGDQAMVLCFVEFNDAKCAMTALEALQGLYVKVTEECKVIWESYLSGHSSQINVLRILFFCFWSLLWNKLWRHASYIKISVSSKLYAFRLICLKLYILRSINRKSVRCDSLEIPVSAHYLPALTSNKSLYLEIL